MYLAVSPASSLSSSQIPAQYPQPSHPYHLQACIDSARLCKTLQGSARLQDCKTRPTGRSSAPHPHNRCRPFSLMPWLSSLQLTPCQCYASCSTAETAASPSSYQPRKLQTHTCTSCSHPGKSQIEPSNSNPQTRRTDRPTHEVSSVPTPYAHIHYIHATQTPIHPHTHTYRLTTLHTRTYTLHPRRRQSGVQLPPQSPTSAKRKSLTHIPSHRQQLGKRKRREKRKKRNAEKP